MRELTRLEVPTPTAERPRRLRATPATRSLVKETRLTPRQLIAPLFIVNGRDVRQPIESLTGQSRLSPDLALDRARELAAMGVGGLLLFGIPDAKDAEGRAAADRDGPVPTALRRIKDAGLPPDYPNDAAWRTTMTGREIARIRIPCRRDRYTATGGPDTWWPTPEPPRRA